ncbi:MAG: hypothetical protein GF329_07095 [Candidatus Lokiarchaeota archaeon]|nr:hypothetical protein [Candidatus Lokiarchaeota archaeon]
MLDASKYYKKKLDEEKLISGIKPLDELLEGFERGVFYMLYDSPQVTASILKTLAVAAQLPVTHGGLNSKVVFVDAQNIFNPYSIGRKAVALGLSATSVLENIQISRAFIFPHLHEIITQNLEETAVINNAKLVLVSGIVPEPNLEMDDIKRMIEIMGVLNRLASVRKKVVVVSNYVALNSDYKPAGGKACQHYPNVIVRILTYEKLLKYRLIKHPSRPPKEVLYFLNEKKERRISNTRKLDYYFNKEKKNKKK